MYSFFLFKIQYIITIFNSSRRFFRKTNRPPQFGFEKDHTYVTQVEMDENGMYGQISEKVHRIAGVDRKKHTKEQTN